MNHLKKVLFGLALAVALVSFGARNASADCTENKPVTTATSVHAEGTTELLATMTIVCTNGTAGAKTPAFVGSATSNMSLVFSPTTTKVTIGAGATPSTAPAAPGVQGICSATAPDNRSSFPCPQIQAVTSTPGAPNAFATPTVAVTTSGNILNFNFTACSTVVGTLNPPGVGVCPGDQPLGATLVGGNSITFTVTGIRINVASTALPAGGAVTASEVTSGGVGSVSNGSVVFGIVQQTLGLGTGLTNATTIAFAACGPKVATPLGTPATLAPAGGLSGNPDTTAGLSSTLKVAFAEGFLSAFALAGTLDNGFASQGAPTLLQPNPTGAAGGVGLRLRINLSGIPSGFVVYAPEQVSAASLAATGSVVLGAGAGLTVLTLVSAPAADGSGGVLVGAVKDQYDLVTPTGGVAAITYEVTANASPTGLEVVNINVALTGTATTGVGSISAQLSLGPVGPPTINAALPQFAAINKPGVVATVGLCASYLLFPWVVTTNDGNYDTGFAIANTTSDPSVIGTTGQSGDVNLYIFPSDGSAAITQSIATGLKPGATATFVLSSLKKAVAGYAIAVCNFTLGHGFAFIDNPIAGQNGFAEGYLALSITNPRLGAALGLNESAGH